MSTYFFYENGQGEIINEEGKDAMDWAEEVDRFHTILGAIYTMGVVDIDLRITEKPKQCKFERGTKRKQTTGPQRAKGTTTGHCLSFIRNTLDEMNNNPLMSNFFIVIDNAPIHMHRDIDELITLRCYRSIYLPSLFAQT
jgi:hypothetical protein